MSGKSRYIVQERIMRYTMHGVMHCFVQQRRVSFLLVAQNLTICNYSCIKEIMTPEPKTEPWRYIWAMALLAKVAYPCWMNKWDATKAGSRAATGVNAIYYESICCNLSITSKNSGSGVNPCR
jgi:hypothetical protein